jgi:hypothetical protein
MSLHDVRNIEDKFSYHAPSDSRTAVHEEVNRRFKELALWLNESLTNTSFGNYEGEQALERLFEARMWSNAAVAINL